MKKFLLLFLTNILFSTFLTAQITYIDYGDGWVITNGANEAVDLNQDGNIEFHVNALGGAFGFYPIFNVGCFTSPYFKATNNLNSLMLQIHEEGDLVQMSGDNFIDYIDDDYGLIYFDGIGIAEGWQVNEFEYIGFAIFHVDGGVSDGWMKVKYSEPDNAIVIKELAYTAATLGSTGTGIIVGDKGLTDTKKVKEAWLNIFPNPTNDWLELDFEGSDTKFREGKIFDASGRLMQSLTFEQLSKNELRLNVSNWPSGSYIFVLKTNDSIQSFNFAKE